MDLKMWWERLGVVVVYLVFDSSGEECNRFNKLRPFDGIKEREAFCAICAWLSYQTLYAEV
jgi:hypothetical protein